MSLKQEVGAYLIPKLPVSRHVFNHIRSELNAFKVSVFNILNPKHRSLIDNLKKRRNLLVNIGCGPFGKTGWVNIDLFASSNVTFVADCRKKLPLGDASCLGIHVEHYLEHLDPIDERPFFLKDCLRCLQPEGVLRVIVPDAELYIRAYLEPGWGLLNKVGCGGDIPEKVFKCKLDALNHIFIQGWEHYGGYDADCLSLALQTAGFTRITRFDWQSGNFPGGCIDREQHRSYSLYFEARV